MSETEMCVPTPEELLARRAEIDQLLRSSELSPERRADLVRERGAVKALLFPFLYGVDPSDLGGAYLERVSRERDLSPEDEAMVAGMLQRYSGERQDP